MFHQGRHDKSLEVTVSYQLRCLEKSSSHHGSTLSVTEIRLSLFLKSPTLTVDDQTKIDVMLKCELVSSKFFNNSSHFPATCLLVISTGKC